MVFFFFFSYFFQKMMKSLWETLDTIFVELKKFYFILKKKKKNQPLNV